MERSRNIQYWPYKASSNIYIIIKHLLIIELVCIKLTLMMTDPNPLQTSPRRRSVSESDLDYYFSWGQPKEIYPYGATGNPAKLT